ncbi:MAG: ATP-binding protein [Ignavibacteriaceae bacterium]|jgi:MinD superfamily P-loop ATPase|nr:ATP-binding protein [Ignavibacteriaceae bacterium]
MKEVILSIASGKGGTGKTTIAASLASIIPNSVYIDCDVEEPNGHLLLKPKINTEEFVSKLLPKIDPYKCTVCGKCVEVCEFNALINLKFEITLIDEMCHGCGACTYFCPEKAITEIEKPIGVIRKGVTEEGIIFIDGLLNIGEVAAAPLIKAVKKKIALSKNDQAVSFSKGEISNRDKTSKQYEISLTSIKSTDDINQQYLFEKTYIIDSPPGTSCSMVEAVSDSDYCILVTESTPFGLNDLKLAMEVLKTIDIPYGVVINKYDASYIEIEKYLEETKTDLLMKIPFDRKYAVAYSKGILPIVLYPELKNEFLGLFDTIKEKLMMVENV